MQDEVSASILELATRLEALERRPVVQTETILLLVREMRADIDAELLTLRQALRPPIQLTFERVNPAALLPTRATPQASGLDLATPQDYHRDLLRPGHALIVDTGWRVDLPEGYEGQIRSRSGLAAKQRVFVLNSPGTIDADYVGTLKVILYNAGEEMLEVGPAQKIAQLVVAPVCLCEAREGAITKRTTRGAGGFGSTGR